MRNLSQEIEQGLPPKIVGFLHTAGEVTAHSGMSLFLVGGPVRDLLLGRAVIDLDLVVEGDALLVASLLAKELGGEVSARSQFNTAKIKSPLVTLDLATARLETYERPGALPKVRAGSIRDDLARRDFTINTMAVRLGPERFGGLEDPFQGLLDLQDKRLRVLHPNSFVDDATRILRALRYEQRLGFRMDLTTEGLAQRHAHYLENISGDRVRRELERIFQEPLPEAALVRAEELGVLTAILPGLSWDATLQWAIARLRNMQGEPEPLLFVALLAWPLTVEQANHLVQRLNLSSRWARAVRDTLSLRERLQELEEAVLQPSAVYRLLKGFEPEAIQSCMLATELPRAQQRLEAYSRQWRHVQPHLRPAQLLALGVPRG
ncbi:MAG: hypothetical protein HYY31_00020, partial [Chloroflexi bacterium]|nr:hypothetical protein [Chloroflexota bacterium]